ncbi:hypothetical protein [Micromonospora sp. b486]|uniref:hypothetical protein n=1 Tax=Micromonospora sp. b486 TaxID=3053986 RepID=UPI00259D0ACF|nr:hypothetical protein [Micromonospora sp. b486]MDM4778118.1 hypothetical protein [Micromonospora sp. b486]
MDADEIAAGRARWQARYDAARKRDADFTTLSGLPVEPVYGPPEDRRAVHRLDRQSGQRGEVRVALAGGVVAGLPAGPTGGDLVSVHARSSFSSRRPRSECRASS